MFCFVNVCYFVLESECWLLHFSISLKSIVKYLFGVPFVFWFGVLSGVTYCDNTQWVKVFRDVEYLTRDVATMVVFACNREG